MRKPWLILLFLLAAAAAYCDKTGSTHSNANTTGPGSATPGESRGDPVGVADGAVYDAVTDVRVACPGVDLVFRRSYGSWSQRRGSLGVGWTHSYDWRVETNAAEVCVFSAGEEDVTDGVHRFAPVPPGGSAFDDEGYELRRSADGLFSVATPRGLTYGFDGLNRLERIDAWSGESVSVSRDGASGSVVRADHSCGKSLVFGLDGGGSIVSVSTPDPSVRAEYVYSADAPGGPVGAKLLVRAVRRDGGRESAYSYAYEALRRPGTQSAEDVAASAGGGGRTQSGEVYAVAPLHYVGGSPPSSVAFFGTCCVLARKTDPNRISTDYAYARPGDGAMERCVRTKMTGGLLEHALSYGENWTLVSRETAFGTVRERFYFDDAKREVLSESGDETRHRAYNSRGDLEGVVAANRVSRLVGRVVYGYDDRRRVVSRSCSLRAVPSRTWTFGWDDLSGALRRVASPGGRVSEWVRGEFRYDVYGAGTNDHRLVSSVACDPQWRPVSAVGPDGGETRLSYGADGLVSRVEADGLPAMDIGRDLMGNVSSVSLPGPDGTSRTVSASNNWKGRPLSVSYPDGTSESFAYDGNGTKSVRRVDRLGREDVYRWVLGLPVHAGRVIGGVTNTLFGVEHDKQLNVVSITDPLGRKAEAYALDENDRVVAATNLEGQVMTRAYALGELVASETRFDGTRVSYAYDVDANISSVAYPGGTLSFGYDADGFLTAASSGAGLVTNLYDAATGWLDATRGADGTWVSYARSDGGAVTSETSVAGTTAYARDAAGRRTRLAAPSAAFGFGYCGWNGRLAAVTNGNGLVTSYAYDIMDRVTNISWKTTGGASLGGFAYEYDALGRITSRNYALGGAAFDRAYAYDDLDRLASDGGVAYTYDAAGNRMTRTEDGETVTYTLGQGDRLASWTGGAYTHDVAGNVTRIERDGRPTLGLTWNSQYQLVSVATNGVFAESYAYDALGRRVSTTTQEGTTRHVYDSNWQVIADIDENGSVVASYVWGESIDNLLAVTIGGATYYPLTDVQGTVWGYVDSQNNIVARWQYDAWGNVLSEYVAPSAAALAALRYRFQGREWSAATGLINFRMRWYDAETGRWLSKDPIGLNGGLNLYVFCGDVPLQFRDLFGLCKDSESEKEIIKTKELLTGGNFFLDAYLGCQLHGAGKLMDYAAVDHSSKWKFPSGEIRNSNQMGNYMAGYDAGYSESPLLMYAGVRGGGMLFGALGGVEGWRDSGSVPDINAGFFDGVAEKALDDVMSDPFVRTIFAVIDLFK